MRIHVASHAHNPAVEHPDDPILWMELGTGLIRVIGQSQWTPMQVEQHFVALDSLIAEQRRNRAPVLVLIDLRDSLIQPPDIVERIGRAIKRVCHSSDRVAVVVASSFLKHQLKQVVDATKIGFFVSANTARTWLTTRG